MNNILGKREICMFRYSHLLSQNMAKGYHYHIAMPATTCLKLQMVYYRYLK